MRRRVHVPNALCLHVAMHSLSVERRSNSPRLQVKQRARLYYTHVWPPAGLSFWVFRIEASYMLPFFVGSISPPRPREAARWKPQTVNYFAMLLILKYHHVPQRLGSHGTIAATIQGFPC